MNGFFLRRIGDSTLSGISPVLLGGTQKRVSIRAPIICMAGIDTAPTRLSRIDSVDTVIDGGIGSDFVLSDPP